MKTVFSGASSSTRAGFSGLALFAGALLTMLFGDPHAALAQAATLGDVMCSVSANITPFAYLFNGISYIAGAILIGSGLLLFIKYKDGSSASQAGTPLTQPVARCVAGACLLALPSTITLFVNSVFGFTSGGGISGRASGMTSGGSGYVGLDTLVMNLVMNIKDPMVFMLSTIAIVSGIFLIIRGLVKAAKFGTDPRGASVPVILANLIIGTILVVVGQSLDVMLGSIFGTSSVADSSTISWAFVSNDFGNNTQQFQNAVYAALTFFQLIGMIAFIRGFLILKDVVEGAGQKTLAQGFTHIIGGVLAINIYYFLVVMDNTFGTGFLSGGGFGGGGGPFPSLLII